MKLSFLTIIFELFLDPFGVVSLRFALGMVEGKVGVVQVHGFEMQLYFACFSKYWLIYPSKTGIYMLILAQD